LLFIDLSSRSLRNVNTKASGQKCMIIGAPQSGHGNSPAAQEPTTGSQDFINTQLILTRLRISGPFRTMTAVLLKIFFNKKYTGLSPNVKRISTPMATTTRNSSL
jgi:hypothetical protein